jgi:formiminotetrahydrofolate cyclodeaminase
MDPPSADWTIKRFLDRLASSNPIPGGGSAAALAGCLGVGLGVMVAEILLARRGLPTAQRREIERSQRALDELLRRLIRLIRQDAEAYLQFVEALQTGCGRIRVKRSVLDCPVQICEAVVKADRLLRALQRRSGPYLGADAMAGRALLKGAFDAGWAMVESNLHRMDGGRQARHIRRRLAEWRHQLQR